MKTNHDSEAIEMQKRANEQRSQKRNDRMSTAKHVLGELRYEQRSIAGNNQITHQILLGDSETPYVIAEHRTLGKSSGTEADWTELVRRWNTQPQLLEALKQVVHLIKLLNLPGANDPIEAAVYKAELAIEKAS